MGEKSAVRILQALLNGEISAVETYKSAAHHLPDTEIGAELLELAVAHEKSARKLRRRLRQLGTTAGAEVGIGGFAFPELEGSLSDDLVALSILQEGEQRALSAYQTSLSGLDEASRSLVMHELIPEQELSDNVVTTLRDGMGLLARKSA